MQGKAGCSAEKGNFGKVGGGKVIQVEGGEEEPKYANIQRQFPHTHTKKDKYRATKTKPRLQRKAKLWQEQGWTGRSFDWRGQGGEPCLHFNFKIKS